ncbi:MAG: aminoglycoside phosphotransferase family protein [Clostridia bacterium]|nr:aminoglycoside phosphotransferase family protein [Clostridia bacterium]
MAIIEDKLPGTIDEIIAAYGIDAIDSWKMIHSGHINRTYVIEFTKNGEKVKWLLQHINTEVFKMPVELMENVTNVTSFLRKKITAAGGDPTRETLTVYLTVDGKNSFFDSEGLCWRMYNFVDNAFSYDSIENDEIFYRAGAAFGTFQSQLADFPIDTLHETIVDFHHTYKRLLNLKASEERNASGRACNVKAELDFAKAREEDTKIVVDLIEKGELPLRVTHNDTKLNNIMFDKDTNQPICVVDLDTVMPGSALYDFGDAIRFGASTAAEDEKDLSKVSMDLHLFEIYVKGYLSTAGKSLTEKEVELLPFSAKLLTYECGIRFLADYIDGDVYFGTAYPEHNLDRCRTQFKLVADMESKMDEMIRITKEAYASL